MSLTVKNIGSHAGREVVQIYVSAPTSSSITRAVKSLEGFAKTAILQPGQSENIAIVLPRRSFAYWSEERKSWVVEQGTYSVQVAKSSSEVVASVDYPVSSEQAWVGL